MQRRLLTPKNVVMPPLNPETLLDWAQAAL